MLRLSGLSGELLVRYLFHEAVVYGLKSYPVHALVGCQSWA